MQDCAHNEHKLISILQHFEGLEEGKITWYSNYYHTKTSPLHGLEEKEIAVTQTLENHECAGLGKDEITWYSNNRSE